MSRYQRTFDFFNTEEEAKTFCDNTNKNLSYYARKNHKATYTSWQSQDGKQSKFVAWHSYK